jgi:hypothetical protein
MFMMVALLRLTLRKLTDLSHFRLVMIPQIQFNHLYYHCPIGPTKLFNSSLEQPFIYASFGTMKEQTKQ